MIALIPTKGRPCTSTYKLLQNSGFKVFHFIEPQEVKSYSVANVINIGENNRGISFVRNFMLEWARDNGHQFVVICDDDLNHFGVVKRKKSVKQPNADALLQPFKVFSNSNFALAGINQRQFAWSETKPYKINNGKVNGCIFVNLNRACWRYNEDTKEDIDFAMQCLDNRQSFIYFCKVFYNTPAIGSNFGGLHESYEANRDKTWSKRLHMDWPAHSKIITQYGRTDCRVDFKSLAKERGLDVR